MSDKALAQIIADEWLKEAKRLGSAPVPCDCGCGDSVTVKTRFKQGHDAKLRSKYAKRIEAILTTQAN